MMAGLRRKSMLALLFVSLLGIWFWSGCERESSDIPTDYSTFVTLVNEGWEAYRAGEFEQAIEKFNEALSRTADPTVGRDAYRGLGWTYSRVGQYERAVANFQFVLSAEAVSSGRTPILTEEKAHFEALADESFELDQDSSALIVKVHRAINPGTRKVGETYSSLEPGAKLFSLRNDRVSNQAGDDLGSPLDNSLVLSTPALARQVCCPESLLNLEDYFVDCPKGQVTFLPRYDPISSFTANYRYEEERYIVDFVGYYNIVLADVLDAADPQTGNPLPAPSLNAEDIILVDFDRYNPPEVVGGGGTYYQADAYAGIAAAYAAKNDDQNAIAAARAAIFIDQDLPLPTAVYPDTSWEYYHRHLYNGDETTLWHVYELLGNSYFNNKDFIELEELLENFLAVGEVANPEESDYEVKLYNALRHYFDSGPPPNWEPPQIP